MGKFVYMKKLIVLVMCIVSILMLTTSCNEDINIPTDSIAYENSFESLRDTVNWENRENISIVDGGSPIYGGYYSLHIKSGVNQPAASREFISQAVNDKLQLGFFAKMDDTLETAIVKLESVDGESIDFQTIQISGSGWKEYRVTDDYEVPHSGKFKINIYTSSKENAGIQIDLITLFRKN